MSKRFLLPPSKREHKRHAHYPDEPREDEISYCQSVPLAVTKEPVATSSIVDKDHDNQGHTKQKQKFFQNKKKVEIF